MSERLYPTLVADGSLSTPAVDNCSTLQRQITSELDRYLQEATEKHERDNDYYDGWHVATNTSSPQQEANSLEEDNDAGSDEEINNTIILESHEQDTGTHYDSPPKCQSPPQDELDTIAEEEELQMKEQPDAADQDTLVFTPEESEEEPFNTAIDDTSDDPTIVMGKPVMTAFISYEVCIPPEKVGCLQVTSQLQEFLKQFPPESIEKAFEQIHQILQVLDLKYQTGSEMHTSDALSRLHNFTDTADQKDVIPLNFLQHFTPHYIEHSYSHLVENLYAYKTKTLDATPVKRKRGRPPKPKPQIPSSNPRTPTAAKNLTAQPQQYPRSLNNEIVSRQMIDEIKAEREKSDRLTVAKLNAVKQFNKQDHKSKLMTEKYSLLPLNPQQLTPVQIAIQRMSEKHPDFEIEPVNTIRPPEIEYTQMPQALVPIDTPLSIICKHIPRQSDIDKIVKNIETHVIHSLELPIQAQDLVKAYQHSTRFHDIYQYITDGKLPSSTKAQNCIRTEALIYVIINHFLFRIDT